MRIIVVEDDSDLREELVFSLEAGGFNTYGVGDGDSLYRELNQQPADIVVLDVGLPGEDGFSIASRLRKDPVWQSIGIILLTARGDLNNRVQGFNSGADLYLIKPVDFNELRACIESLLRRLAHVHPDAVSACWGYSSSRWELLSPSRVTIKLTLNEKNLVELLLGKPGEVISRGEIVVKGLGESLHSYDERRLEAMVSRLRRKIGLSHPFSSPIQTVHGIGYVFTEQIVHIGPDPLPISVEL